MSHTRPEGQQSDEAARRVRRHVVEMAHEGGSSHVGSALSCSDILAVLYFDEMNVDSELPNEMTRDRFVMSKGHAGSALYAVLAVRGFISTDLLSTHYQNGSLLSGHVSHKGLAGIEFSTGSLGHGLSLASGLAHGQRLQSLSARTYVLLSDGECDEGATWEAAMYASHYGLANLTAIIDYNKLQSLGPVDETIRLEPLVDKWEAFGWEVTSTDGHDHARLRDVLARRFERPHVVVAHTIKGKGVSFMENEVLWHYRSPNSDEYARAMDELKRE